MTKERKEYNDEDVEWVELIVSEGREGEGVSEGRMSGR